MPHFFDFRTKNKICFFILFLFFTLSTEIETKKEGFLKHFSLKNFSFLDFIYKIFPTHLV